MELTPCLGLGDILILKQKEIDNHLNIKMINISKPLIHTYRQYPERYFEFIQRLLKCMFPNVVTAIVDAPHQALSRHEYPVTHRYIYDSIRAGLSTQIKPPTVDNYIVFHTKVRLESATVMTQFINNDLPLLGQFFANFKIPHNQTVVITGERTIENCLEQKVLNIGSIYKELMLLANNNTVIDMTKEVLYSGNPDYNDFENDINLIHHANLNVSIGHGGNMNMAYAFSRKNVSFQGAISAVEFTSIFDTYPNAHQTLTPFLTQLEQKCNQIEPLIIMVLACATNPKYRDYIHKIEATWGQRAHQLNIKVLYFLGEEATDLIGERYIYLKGVANDYLSASDKQRLGLEYIYDHYNAKYVFCCGSDTYLNVDKMIQLLEKYDYRDRLLIGGHILSRSLGMPNAKDNGKDNGNNVISFSGGGGFIISRTLVGAMYHQLKTMTSDWQQLCLQAKQDYLIPACDVCIGYYAKMHQGDMVCYQNRFTGCNYQGHPECCVGKIQPHHLITCHNMSLSDFDDYTLILKEQQYFTKMPNYPRNITPNCTLVISCQSISELNTLSDEIIQTPCFMAIYCSLDTMEALIKKRGVFNTYQTVYYYHPIDQEKTSHLYRYHLLSRTITINPFDTDKFLWIDGDLSITRFQLLKMADQITDNFHIYVSGLNEVKSDKYLFNYQISTQIIGCGSKCKTSVLDKLINNEDITTLINTQQQTSASFVKGHGAIYDIVQNFIIPRVGLDYLYEAIFINYQRYRSYDNICQIGSQLLSQLTQHEIDVDICPERWLKILYAYYISAYSYQPKTAYHIANMIKNLCQESGGFYGAYNLQHQLYDEQLICAKYLIDK